MRISFSTRSSVLLLAAFSLLVCLGQAFIVPDSTYSVTRQRCKEQVVSSFKTSPREIHSVSLSAKKRRRRRKNKDQSSPSNGQQLESLESSPIPQPGSGVADELPDFDLDGGEAAAAVEKEIQKRKPINPSEITSNMMGSGATSSRSLDELISDRSLESKFEFEEKGDASIPDFVDLAKASSTVPTFNPDTNLSTAGVGKKKQRQAERIARAVAAKEAEEPEESFMSRFFPQLLDEEGKVSGVKLLENGAWAGIYLLIAWEAYINSPFFERAAPLAPVVFEIVM
mmetsp:Transcript_3174/g.8589  ORF Transcript_3174/g.8589 Transcript_3174/m.8589 type:complete len:284 (+) Transcript_3174:95-946(+)|eukprot:CAMPEP_0197177718 /NCGR_PEP_ID=MMETSP1423-20130617/3230_1 /TAXON_ID=476441 /ORGANISM="Pseudo-nitzschia heimii, Strain UNC1101" /LENGTH=283 /DNA_ID=CAMNT_0042627315 /DNA_START=52 /DNA_END=903 /DNA_ORIENTATION=-